MSGEPDLPSLGIGDRIQGTLLVLEIEARAGDAPHTILLLGNHSGRLPSAPIWASTQSMIAGIRRGDPVRVIGEVTSYRDQRQLKVSAICALPRKDLDWRALMPSAGDPSPDWKRLDQWRREIRGPRLGATLARFYDDPDFRRRYQECPASLGGHHAVLGGLLRHTREVAEIARPIGAVCGADLDLVLAGVLLHDIGKLEAYTWEGCFAMTDRGALLGHVVLGSLMLERRAGGDDPAPCTEQERMLLHHLILSHHGRGEFGAPVTPMTLEAEVLHYADNASAKTASMAQAIADPDNFAGGQLVSTRTIWQLDRRRAYRGGSNWGNEQGAATERPLDPAGLAPDQPGERAWGRGGTSRHDP